MRGPRSVLVPLMLIYPILPQPEIAIKFAHSRGEIFFSFSYWPSAYRLRDSYLDHFVRLVRHTKCPGWR